MNVLAIVLARAGSNGVPRKNTVDCIVAGKPLIAWTLEDALESEVVTEVVVSTDDLDTAFYVNELGDAIHAVARPAHLAGPDVSSEDAMAPIIEGRQPDIIVLLQLTSPVRTGQDIDNAVRMITDEGYDSVLSVAPSHAFLWRDGDIPQSLNYDYSNRPMRQNIKRPCYEENGSIYVTSMEQWRRTGNRLGGRVGLYHMAPETRLQIDSPLDLYLVERIMERQAMPV